MSDSDQLFRVELPPLKGVPSSVKMTPNEMLAFNLEHSRRFMEGDIDEIMNNSLVDDPVYEFYPSRIRVSGKEAVRRYHEIEYRRTIQEVDPRNGGDTREFYAVAFGENTFIAEFSSMMNMPDGSCRRCYMNAVVPFANGKMTGERVWMDHDLAAWFEAVLDQEFFDLPGVERF